MTESIYTAPVLLFAYNRPDHLQRTIDALKENEGARETDVLLFVDGLPEGADAEKADRHRRVLDTARSAGGFRSVEVRESDINKGLAASIIGGISSVLETTDRVIVLEDDLVTSPYFLRFMNEALEKYRHEEQVQSISGYIEPVDTKQETAFFLTKGSSWGWGTWKRVWDDVIWDIDELLERISGSEVLTDRLNYSGANYLRMLENQKSGKVDSWAIRFFADSVVKERIHLNPAQTLVANIGFDQSGTHCEEDHPFYGKDRLHPSPMPLPERIELNSEVPAIIRETRDEAVRKAQPQPGLLRRVYNKVRWTLSSR